MTFAPDTTIEVRLDDAREYKRATVVGPHPRTPSLTIVRIGNWEYTVKPERMREYIAPAPVVIAPIPPCGDCGKPSTLDGKTMSCCDPCAEARGWEF